MDWLNFRQIIIIALLKEYKPIMITTILRLLSNYSKYNNNIFNKYVIDLIW